LLKRNVVLKNTVLKYTVIKHKVKRMAFLWIFFITATCLSSVSYGDAYPTLPRDGDKYLSDGDLPARTPPIVELGASFLGTGNIEPGFVLPTGAVWSPALWVYGNFRTAYQRYRPSEGAGGEVAEWVNRLDLFANLQLTGTERILLGLTPLHDRDKGEFYGKIYEPDSLEENNTETNAKIDTLFFEGDFAELFPNIDYFDSTKNDIGFSIGRQQMLFMDGFLINDSMDGIGLSKNNMRFSAYPWLINWRSTIFVGIDDIDRHTNEDIDNSKLVAWFNQLDSARSTYNVDVVYVDGDEAGDVLNFGGEAIQRIGKINTAFRVAISQATSAVTEQSDNGVLLFVEVSWVPSRSHNNVYVNGFIGIDNFTSAARGPLEGGPLGRAGILFAAQGIGSLPAPISNSAQKTSGFTLGYQRFFGPRRQIVVEVGGRLEHRIHFKNEQGVALRFQQAIGRRAFVQLDAYSTWLEDEAKAEYGTRIELQIKL